MNTKTENNKNNNIQYSLNCVYQKGKIHRTGLTINGIVTDVCKWNGQLVTSLMNTLDLKDYLQTIQRITSEKPYEKIKELKYPLLKLCELMDLDINQIDVLDYIIRIHNFSIWLFDLINARNNNMEYFKIDLGDITMEYSLSKEYEDCSMVRFSCSNIFILAQIEFAEYYKSGIPYIVCEKCGTVYFTHKIKSTKTCPFCICPSLDKNSRAIEKQAERLFNATPKLFEQKFTDYLITKKDFSIEEAIIEYNKQLEKRKRRNN